jgi:hypothetical protein
MYLPTENLGEKLPPRKVYDLIMFIIVSLLINPNPHFFKAITKASAIG